MFVQADVLQQAILRKAIVRLVAPTWRNSCKVSVTAVKS